MRSLIPLLSILFLPILPAITNAVEDGPKITSQTFDNDLLDVFYFDDSNVILAHEYEVSTVWRSEDAGSTWKKIKGDGQEENSIAVIPHPWDNQRAYILGPENDHWMTKDQGKSWKKFNIGRKAAIFSESLSFHGRDPKKIIWNGETCSGLLDCAEVSVYTDDDFESTNPLDKAIRRCYWATSTPMFAVDKAKDVDNRVFCIKKGLHSSWPKDNRLVYSNDYFKTEESEPALDAGRAVNGVISMASVKKFLVAAAKSEGTDELALYVTDDGSEWHRAEFGQHKVTEEAYTILESTDYSMQVDVMGSLPQNPMGFLFTSNSNGTYFTKNIEYTNRNHRGRVDFEKVSNIQGIVLVNVVDNYEDVSQSGKAIKKVVSRISFDDGRNFEDINVGKDQLHLHSVTDARQFGRIFSSPAPGLVMGVGNTGKFLKPYEDGDLYVSDDAGLTWRLALEGAHLYEFGNSGAVLVAVEDERATSTVRYSLDHGSTWKKAELETKVRARVLTTVQDSTTLNFLLGGFVGKGAEQQWIIYKLDFEGLHERKCKDKDFERWPARVDDDNNPSCVMGRKQFYRRRKADALCVIDADFKDPEPEFESCACTETDFECDFNFVRSKNRKDCEPTAQLQAPEGECKNPEDKFKGSSGWRLIPGNACKREGGVEKDKEIERPCTDTIKKPASGQISVEKTPFKASKFGQWAYLERSETSTGDDETIIMSTGEQEIFLSKDHGKKWHPILEGKPITGIIQNPHYYDALYFLTGSKKVHYTIDRGENFHEFEVPDKLSMSGGLPLKFHPEHKDWMLWSGIAGTDDHTNVHWSKDRGDNWNTLARYTEKCDFIHLGDKDSMIYCEQYQDENPHKHLQLTARKTFDSEPDVKFPNILHFTTMAEFIIVAAKTEDEKSLKVDASIDGVIFAPAEFPRNFPKIKEQKAYTVLDSSTHAVFLHVTVNQAPGHEFGSIIKSNSNGTSYVLVLNSVNRDEDGYVDFEKMQGLEGVSMVNVVANSKEVQEGGRKKLKSMITHNDGAQWALIPPPKQNFDGRNYECVGDTNVASDQCSLHLHQYTERMDKTATFSSPSAIGMMMAVGNVGEFLARKDSEGTDTFITRDAGITWKSVKKGSHLWEYGDQGSIIVIVPEIRPTKSIFYTLDEGNNWEEFEFSDTEMEIFEITTVPSDNSRNFLLWGREASSTAKGGIFTVNLDFSGLKQRQRPCKLDEDNPESDDYELWSPKHPKQTDDCLFGHVAQYHRKRLDAECYNGKTIPRLHNIKQNCTCTRSDYECDYNFEIQTDGTCQLVPGLEAPDHLQFCKDHPDAIEFWKPTGYRKIPLSTCQGGREYDKIESKPCPGHEDQFERKYSIGGIALFFAIVVPLVVASGVGYWVWQKYQMAGFGGFGQIRLGDPFASSSRSSGDSLFITIPVAIISGIVAVAKALPLLASSLFRSARGYTPIRSTQGNFGSGPYRSRDAFANRRNDFAGDAYIEDDELLGDGDEEADEDV